MILGLKGLNKHNGNFQDGTAWKMNLYSCDLVSRSLLGVMYSYHSSLLHSCAHSPRQIHPLMSSVWSFCDSTVNSSFVCFRLKEMFSHMFEDLCLYCEVSDILGLYKFKIHIRRFIQGLFANVNFDSVN